MYIRPFLGTLAALFWATSAVGDIVITITAIGPNQKSPDAGTHAQLSDAMSELLEERTILKVRGHSLPHAAVVDLFTPCKDGPNPAPNPACAVLFPTNDAVLQEILLEAWNTVHRARFSQDNSPSG